MNDFIPQEFCSVNYATVDNAVQIIRRLGKGCAMAKTDVTSAFRIIPVHPADYHLLGVILEREILCRLLFNYGVCKFMQNL